MMAHNPGRAPFDEDEVHVPLRRPHIKSKETTAITFSKLSLTAPEFIPSKKFATSATPVTSQQHEVSAIQKRLMNKQQLQVTETLLRTPSPPPPSIPAPSLPSYRNFSPPVTSSVQNRLKISSINGNDASKNVQQQQQQQQFDENHLTANDSVEQIALKYLATVIESLNNNPGSFDRVGSQFLQIFEGLENNSHVLSCAMEDIFNESISNPNFRYMGAKLYNLLHMLNLKKDSLFHTLLKCKLNYHQTEVMDFMMNDAQHKVRETALFLAELYMQLRGDDSRIRLIAENIVFSLKQLLTNTSSENIRCVCLTLKLAGYDLDVDCPIDVKFIIDELYRLNSKNPFIHPLITSVTEMQQSNWGRSVSESSDSELSTQSQLHKKSIIDNNHSLNDEATMYGPDGQILTEDENTFLSAASLMNNNNSSFQIHNSYGAAGDDDDIDSDDIDFDPEMDEEAEKDYRLFCKLSKTTNA